MDVTRRALVAGAAAAPATAHAASGVLSGTTRLLPAKAAFAKMPYVYLDAGSTHPMPLGAKAALEDYLRFKTRDGPWPGYDMGAKERAVVEAFGALVGAAPDELCIVQSTTMGENLVLASLGVPRGGGRIVTDALHFFGSFYTYGELAKAGMDVVTLPMTPDGRIEMSALEAAVNGRTRLVALSHVSTVNGFEHDLKRVCDIAHAHGALVYADIVHGAGSTPLDLRATGVDFAACSSYKWLMGDFGLAFLYVRREIQDRVERPWWGYHQVGGRFQTHLYPFDPPGDLPAEYGYARGAAGKFAMGTTSWTGVVQLEHSLGFIHELTVPAIQAWRQPMADAIQGELRRRGYRPLTPEGSRTPLVAFALKDARARLAGPLAEAGVRMTVSAHRFRVSLSVFNDMNDVDRLLEALPKAPPA
ncbi:aminotransferase class V-fold PLP-dependent enzyme [Phenylobacterium sp.]|uniref:aminotransferase class V-fold PLP-dependent enzyme n=1 Tax=Phenylobacterium sp. TaxID=1871053 RepID=UPI00301BED38